MALIYDGAILRKEDDQFLIALSVNGEIHEMYLDGKLFRKAKVRRSGMPFKAHFDDDKLIKIEAVCGEDDYVVKEVELSEEHQKKLDWLLDNLDKDE